MSVVLNSKFKFLFVFWLICSSVFAETNPDSLFLPKPSGPFSVGTCKYFLENKIIGKKKKTQRLTVKIWYPSDEKVKDADCNLYLENYDMDEIFRNFRAMGVTRKQVMELGEQRTHSCMGLKISDKESKYPLLVFSPGYFFGANDIYSAFIENLASNGYIVIAVSNVNEQICEKDPDGEDNSLHMARTSLPYFQMWLRDKRSFRSYDKPENQKRLAENYLHGLKRFNKKLLQWECNIKFVLNDLKINTYILPQDVYSHMDFGNIGIFGQSFGGALANDLCVRSDMIKSAVNIDGFQFGCVSDTVSDKPLMLIEGEQQLRWRIGNEFIYRNYPDLQYIKVFNSLHFLFSDLPFFNRILGEDKVQWLVGKVNGSVAVEWLNKEILDFFDHSLKNKNVIFYDGENMKNIDGNNYLIQKTNRCIFLK